MSRRIFAPADLDGKPIESCGVCSDCLALPWNVNAWVEVAAARPELRWDGETVLTDWGHLDGPCLICGYVPD